MAVVLAADEPSSRSDCMFLESQVHFDYVGSGTDQTQPLKPLCQSVGSEAADGASTTSAFQSV